MAKTFRSFLRKRFDFPVRKLPVHLNLGCPHFIDGKGCIYCDNGAFSDLNSSSLGVAEQIENRIAQFRKNGFSGKFIVYFQSQTNTNAPVDVLERLFSPVRNFVEDVVGISVATRPDCLDLKKVELLESFSDDFLVWAEVGLQSANNDTLKLINRGHSVEDFLRAMEL